MASVADASAAPAASDASSDVDARIEALVKVLEEKIAEHGEHSIEVAPTYVDYASALLRKAQAEGDPFGSALPGKKEGEAPPADEAVDDDDDDAEGGGEGEDAAEGEEGTAEESDDLELSFQCLEVARLIYEKHGGHDLKLADVFELLAEVSMENEMWENAIGEIRQSLELKQPRLEADDRQLAHLHYQLATAASAQVQDAQQTLAGPPAADAPPPDEPPQVTITRCQSLAAEHYKLAADVLERRSKAVVEGSEEAADLAELLAEVRSKADEHEQAKQQASKAGKAKAASTTTIGFGEIGSSTTTIGFGAPSGGETTIGFGAPIGSSTTTIGFGGASGGDGGSSSGFAAPSSMPVTVIEARRDASGRKKAVLVPTSTTNTSAAGTNAAPPPACAPVPPAGEDEGLEAKPKRARIEPTPTTAA